VILLPGESLSIYDYLYPCTEENGYRSAVAYADGGYVDSIGGGICQIATTLYNALLEAELKVLTRAPHSMTVSYVEPGFDAAESEGSKDLSFMNNTDYPVYVEAWASNGTLYCALWGVDTRPSNRTVTYYNNILSRQSPGEPEITEDPSLPAGTTVYDQDSYDAIVVELYKQVTVDGEVTETTLLHTDRYKASAAKIRVGTGGAAEQSEESAENTEG
jgi:vancomycin resistance protein YoaR